MSTETHPIDQRTAAVARALPRTLVPGGIGLAGVVVLLVGGHGVSWLAGLVAGAVAGGGGAIWRLRGRLNRLATPPAVGAERRTEAVLEPLAETGWRFLHDIPGPDGPYHHVAVGRGGVILLESLGPDGVVSMRDGAPILEHRDESDGQVRLRRLRPRVLSDALSVRETVRRLAGRRIWVQSVVVLWCDFPAGCVADGRCVYIHGSRLAAWLARRPQQLDAAQIEDVFADVTVLERAAALALPVAV